MSIWKDLLFLGGHVATPAALDALRDAPAGTPEPTIAPCAADRPAQGVAPAPLAVPR
jgi:capsular polysaccharide biosynthesis protein